MRLTTGVLLGLLTTAVTFLGIVLARRGQKEQTRQQDAANALAERAERFDELDRLVSRLSGETERLNTQLVSMERSHFEAIRAQAQKCHEIVDRLIETVATLQTVVQDEVARAAAWASVDEARQHTASHHEPDAEETNGDRR